jgi:GTPase involved in cell partitioning and DNA repair
LCNKTDLQGKEERTKILKEETKENEQTIAISICTMDGLGLEKVLQTLNRIVEDARSEQKLQEHEIADRQYFQREWGLLSSDTNKSIYAAKHRPYKTFCAFKRAR